MTPAEERAFGAQLTAVRAQLFAYARHLTGNRREDAEDLVSEAMLRAWAARERFEPGTNMRGWMFTITRNLFLSERRRDRFRGEYDPFVAENLLAAPAGQESPLHYADAMRAFARLPRLQQDAVAHVALGESYEDAAIDAGCALGTIKSRVARGRAAIIEALDPSPRKRDNVEALPIKRRGPPLPQARPGTLLYKLCELAAVHGVAGTARRLTVDDQAVSMALHGRPIAPRLKRALDAYTEALAA